MNDASRTARRYHWLSEGLTSFVEEPHAAIDGIHQGEIVNLTDRRADVLPPGPARASVFARSRWPHARTRRHRGKASKPRPTQPLLPHLVMPAHHDVRASDVRHPPPACDASRRRQIAGRRISPNCFSFPGVGARTVRALAMVAEVVHGAPCRFTDPARFSFAHGGKDGHPFPVPLKVYDETISVMKAAVHKAKLGQDEGSPRSRASTTRPAGLKTRSRAGPSRI